MLALLSKMLCALWLKWRYIVSILHVTMSCYVVDLQWLSSMLLCTADYGVQWSTTWYWATATLNHMKGAYSTMLQVQWRHCWPMLDSWWFLMLLLIHAWLFHCTWLLTVLAQHLLLLDILTPYPCLIISLYLTAYSCLMCLLYSYCAYCFLTSLILKSLS